MKSQKSHEFFLKKDTLSLGVCNGCQLFIELGLLHPEHVKKPTMEHNDSKNLNVISHPLKFKTMNP